jgi:type III secretory pathway component EscT
VALIAFAALQTAGTFIAYLSSFASALVQDPAADQQSSTIAGFFTTLGVVLVFVTDLHHLMLRAIVDSYGLFTPRAPPPLDDFCSFIARTVAESFGLGVQLAAPFLVVSLVYNVGRLARPADATTPGLLLRPSAAGRVAAVGDDADRFRDHAGLPRPFRGYARRRLRRLMSSHG